MQRLVLSKFLKARPESICAPGIGRDCAALDLSGDLTVLSTDPITSAGIAHLGRLTVHVSCNDAAAAGAEPVGLLVTLLVPPSATQEQIGQIADDLSVAATAAGVDILGGHTEVTDAVTHAVTCATVVARLNPKHALCGMCEGDDIVMTKWAGLEGTTILASDFAHRLTALPKCTLENAISLAKHLSVVPESRIATACGATDMHDITEGGVLGAAWELTYVSNCGICLDTATIPVLPETQAICQALGLDPLRLIGSGSMLISCTDGTRLVKKLMEHNIHACVIGKAFGTELCNQNGAVISPPGADELYRLSGN
ncbi:MAG: AIR synthase related protein [Clostridia bacterium]